MTRRVTVNECPTCGAPVTAREVTADETPECQFCHTALPTVDDSPPPQFSATPFQPAPMSYQSFGAAMPGLAKIKRRVMHWVVFTVVLSVGVPVAIVLALALSHHSNGGGNTGVAGAAGNTGYAAPGSRLDVGYDIQVVGAHKRVTFQVVSGYVQFHATCTTSGTSVGWKVALPKANFSIPAGSSFWYPTSAASASSAYQTVSKFPDLCQGGGMNVYDDNVSLTTSTPNASVGTEIDLRWHWLGTGSNGQWDEAGKSSL